MNRIPCAFAFSLTLLGLCAFACGDDEGSSPGASGSAGSAGVGGGTGSGGGGQGGSKAAGGSSSKGGSAGSANQGGEPASGGSAGMIEGGTGAAAGEDGGGGQGGDGGQGPSGPNIVFISSVGYTAQTLGGLAGADAQCQSLANAASRPGTFVAWLSDSATDARDRLGSARGWVRTDGKPFADRVEDIVAGRHYYTPNLDQLGNSVVASASVITGTGADGGASAPFGDFCQDYTGPNDEYGVVRGDASYYGDERWTSSGELSTDLFACDAVGRLYCFQIDHDDPVDAGFPPSRKAFVSLSAIRPDMGRGGFDAQCETEAEANNLTGSFLAFVATTSASAASRFDLTGLTYARVDGVPIVEQASDLATAGSLDFPIDLHANGVRIAAPNQIVYTGAATPSSLATADTSCNNWSISAFANFVRTGNPTAANASWWDDRSDWRCNTWVKVYCLEE